MNEEQTQPADKMRTSDTGINSMEWRLGNIEKHHQVRKLSSDDGKTYFDTENNVLVMNDGSNNRVVLDGDSMKVSQAGYDADTTTDDKLVMSSEFNMLKIVSSGIATISVSYNPLGDPVQEFTAVVTHDLGYIPSALVYVDDLTPTGRTQVPNTFFFLGDDMFPYAHVSYYIKSTTITFVLTTASGSLDGTRSFKYYLMRETAN